LFICAQSARARITIIAAFYMQIDRENRHGRVSLNGRFEPEQALDLATAALAAAVDQKVGGLVLNLKDLFLTRIMSVLECYSIGEHLARAGRGLDKVAFVTSEECVEPHPFLFTVARNRGLRVATFLSESEALDWLAV
jgi:hypothetical protein